MNRTVTRTAFKALGVAALLCSCSTAGVHNSEPKFRVIGFFTGKRDDAHISFLHEAERWFPEMAAKYNFSFDTTSKWRKLNSDFLARYQVVVFLDTRPEDPAQRHSARRGPQPPGQSASSRDVQVVAEQP